MEPSIPATVYIVDDDPAVLDALRLLMKSENLPARTFQSAREFLDYYQDQPGCLLLDMDMPELDGLEVQQALRERGERLPIIFVTGHGNVPMAVKAIKQGAVDFLQKPFDQEELLELVHHALNQDTRRHDQDRELEELRRRFTQLTRREREVLDKVVAGLPNKTIAHNLGISARTVEIHRSNIMHKLQCRSVAQLVQLVLAIEQDRAQRETPELSQS